MANYVLDFLKSSRLNDLLLVWDVDLALQDSMSTSTTALQREHMWELYDRTDGGVIFFTGRTHQSVNKTFGHDYAGVFEHYSVARFGHGQSIVFMAPEIDIPKMGLMAKDIISTGSSVRIAKEAGEIGKTRDQAVFVEEKNTSIALVHTLNKESATHLQSMRDVLVPAANQIITHMGLSQTHHVKVGNDAVEIVPLEMSKDTRASLHLPKTEMDRLYKHGLSKATAVHNFQELFKGRRMMITGDGEPDLLAMVENKNHYNGVGVYVQNGIPLSNYKKDGISLEETYKKAVDHTIDHHSLTWPMVSDAAIALRAAAPIFKIPSGFKGPSGLQ